MAAVPSSSGGGSVILKKCFSFFLATGVLVSSRISKFVSGMSSSFSCFMWPPCYHLMATSFSYFISDFASEFYTDFEDFADF